MAAEHGAPPMVLSDWVPNTRRALAIAEWTRDQNALHAFREAAMDAYWHHGRNIEVPPPVKLRSTFGYLERSTKVA
ncbi:MAG: hypothetical protein A2289_18260 [Deltaproteobacteria bacterium RIFOXYA12_FULL_58_15]|nr:MAG: hypothetical protein A2289_18260 [Deltaproteobacteria bacterium RIFOXYA12_FULL_58_15]